LPAVRYFMCRASVQTCENPGKTATPLHGRV
jgi:hypothetical protein